MAHLHIHGPDGERQAPLVNDPITIGRLSQADVFLNSPSVSRRHAQISRGDGRFSIQDLGSSNGTYVNSVRLDGPRLLQSGDIIAIGEFHLVFEADANELPIVIQAELPTHPGNQVFFQQDPARKLQAVLDIAHQLAHFSDLDELLTRLLDHLLTVFPKADRGLVLLREGERLVVHATRSRALGALAGDVYSRSVIQRVLDEGLALMAAEDAMFEGQTLRAAGIRSFICVPLKPRRGPALGALQLDCARIDTSFNADDLHLLTAVSIQVSAVLENTTLHNELLENERYKRDLALGRLAQLAAGVAHEVNNPLSLVLNNTAVCRRDIGAIARLLQMYHQAEDAIAEKQPALFQELRAFRDEIELDYTLKNLDDILLRSRDGLKRIQQIVQDLRTFARLNESEFDTVDLAPGLEAAAGLARGLADKRNVKLHHEVSPLPRISCQPARLHEAVFNLLRNAIDACPLGGEVNLNAAATAGHIEIHVRDNGPGVPADVRDKLFDPFFTTKPLGKGVGLGLSISHGIVTEHGGAITLESPPGESGHFVIRLPLNTPPAPPAATAEPRTQPGEERA